jgi:ABC-type antimicrobial peptide transport system permease subunit
MLVPVSYNLRSLFVRRGSTILTVVGIGATVAVVTGVLALVRGFQTLFEQGGHDDVAVFLRPGAPSEGESAFTRDRARTLISLVPEFELDGNEQPLAAMECYLAVRRTKVDGGETNVPIRGTQKQAFDIFPEIEVTEGRRFAEGTDEVIVGRKLVERIQDCQLGDVIQLNLTPFKVVGIFDYDGPFESEIWGDFDRMMEALNRPVLNRVVGKLRPGTDVEALAARLEEDKQVPANVRTEREYLASMTEQLSTALMGLANILGVIMGIAAVFTATNTMLAALSARTHEIGILLSVGYKPLSIFLSFLFEAVLLGLVGGAIGCLMALPLNGVETGTTNWASFTEVAFAFRITPDVLLNAVLFSLLLGLVGGMWPAIRAARMEPTSALRRN